MYNASVFKAASDQKSKLYLRSVLSVQKENLVDIEVDLMLQFMCVFSHTQILLKMSKRILSGLQKAICQQYLPSV